MAVQLRVGARWICVSFQSGATNNRAAPAKLEITSTLPSPVKSAPTTVMLPPSEKITCLRHGLSTRAIGSACAATLIARRVQNQTPPRTMTILEPSFATECRCGESEFGIIVRHAERAGKLI